jgi:hypothetical protein
MAGEVQNCIFVLLFNFVTISCNKHGFQIHEMFSPEHNKNSCKVIDRLSIVVEPGFNYSVFGILPDLGLAAFIHLMITCASSVLDLPKE